ncbi:MAG TPA: endonuclease/exonuclease/phosphatase family protein [Pirellulaceae bacterium]|nr:endonuclease/exonuclease/phosphatase family protein [Pirellulaceae bacterium]
MRGWLGLMVCVLLGASAASAAEPLRVMSFNIRLDNRGDGENAWPHRKEWVAEILREQKPALFGLQEALPHQITDLAERLKDYAWFGAGRDDGKQKGEAVPVFYRRERFEVLEQGNFWLSETPDVPGSKSWDTSITRMVTWLKLKDKTNDQVLLFANTHFDHQGVKARVESARQVLATLPKLAGDAPVVLTGDFNTGNKSEPYNVLTGKGAAATWLLTDARTISKTKPEGPNSTWNGFRKIQPEQQIDFIFVHGLSVARHAILTDEKDGKFPSDHLPLVADLLFP